MIVVCGKIFNPCTSDRHDDLMELAAHGFEDFRGTIENVVNFEVSHPPK